MVYMDIFILYFLYLYSYFALTSDAANVRRFTFKILTTVKLDKCKCMWYNIFTVLLMAFDKRQRLYMGKEQSVKRLLFSIIISM